MSWMLVVIGWLGMVAVFAVGASATAFGAGLPLLLVVGAFARFREESAERLRATAAHGGRNAQGRRSAA